MTNKPTGTSKFHVDVSKSIRDHLEGPNHSKRHKYIFGCMIMMLGTSIINGGMAAESAIIHVLSEGVGALIHAIGAVPIIRSFEKGGRI